MTTDVAPTRLGLSISRARSSRLAASWLSGCGGRPGARWPRHRAHHARQRLDLRPVAVQHLERLPVVRADADLQPHVAASPDRRPPGTPPARAPRRRARRAPRPARPRRATIIDAQREVRGRDRSSRSGSGSATASISVRPSTWKTRIGKSKPSARRASCPVAESASTASDVASWRSAHASAAAEPTLGPLVEQHPRLAAGDEPGATAEPGDRRRCSAPACSRARAASFTPTSGRRRCEPGVLHADAGIGATRAPRAARARERMNRTVRSCASHDTTVSELSGVVQAAT